MTAACSADGRVEWKVDDLAVNLDALLERKSAVWWVVDLVDSKVAT